VLALDVRRSAHLLRQFFSALYLFNYWFPGQESSSSTVVSSWIIESEATPWHRTIHLAQGQYVAAAAS